LGISSNRFFRGLAQVRHSTRTVTLKASASRRSLVGIVENWLSGLIPLHKSEIAEIFGKLVRNFHTASTKLQRDRKRSSDVVFANLARGFRLFDFSENYVPFRQQRDHSAFPSRVI